MPSLTDYFRFVEPVSYLAAGILPSEMVAFMAMCDEQEVDLVIESGRKNGYSTRTLSRWSQEKKVRVFSVETEPIIASDATIKLHDHISLHRGDGHAFVQNAISNEQPSSRIAILLDGPKGQEAVDVITTVRQRLAFAAIHDTAHFRRLPKDRTAPNPGRAAVKEACRGWGIEPIFSNDLTVDIRDIDDTCIPAGQSWNDMTKHGYILAFIKGVKWK